MRILMALAFVALASSQAVAACNDTLLTVVDWTIRPVDARTNELSYTVKSNAGKDIRMIDGQLGFKDALGGHIGPLGLQRDAEIKAGSTFADKGLWGQHTFERLLKLKKDEVTPYTCVRAVLYDDGTKESF